MATKQFTDRMGNSYVDLRVKAPTDVLEFVQEKYGIDRESGQERTRNAQITCALRELQRIKS